MTPDEQDDLQRRTWAAEKSLEERDMTERLIVANLSAVVIAVFFGWNTLWIWPLFFGIYFLLRRRA